MVQVSVREARDKLSQLIKDARAGEEVVISSHGRPVARIVGVESGRPGAMRDSLAEVAVAGDARSPEELDAAIEELRGGWE